MRRPQALAHAAWAALALGSCAFLALTGQSGHPPPIVLVPYVLVAWLVGHALIRSVHYLSAKGRSPAAMPLIRWLAQGAHQGP